MEDWTEESANIIFEKELEIPDVEPEEGSEDNQDTEDDDTNDGDLPQDDDSDGEN